MCRFAIAAFAASLGATAFGEFRIDRSVMGEKYWEIWNDAEQAKIDADIEANRKADAEFAIPAADGTEVEVELVDHEFKFGAHIFNFDQLGKKEYNDAYKASYGKGGIFNSATVAFYWNCYEPVPGRYRAYGDYEDSERFWNSLSREEAMEHPYWRRPSPMPVIRFCRERGIRVHGHILVWGAAKPTWIYDMYCPESEKRECDRFGIPRGDLETDPNDDWTGGYFAAWRKAWKEAYKRTTESDLAAKIPEFTKNMRTVFRDRVFGVAERFGKFVDSWDVVNESSKDWIRYRKSRTGLPVWFSDYGLMPGDYPLWALLDAKEAFPARAMLNINDYNICDDFLAQVNDLQAEGAKIDIVGCQMHMFDTNACIRLANGGSCGNWIDTPKMIQDRLDMMAKTGKKIHISEITITSPGPDYKSRMIQAVLTRNVYRKWFSHKSMMGITWWNTVDGGGVKGEPLVSGLFTTDMKKKPAYEALDQLINHEWKTKLTAKVEGGKVKFRGFRGKYSLVWRTPAGGRMCREAYLSGDGVKEDARDGWSLVKADKGKAPTDFLRVIPTARFYSSVPKRSAKAMNEKDAAAETGSDPVEVKLGEERVSLLPYARNYRHQSGKDGAVAGYLVCRVKAPRDMQTWFYWKCDWYGDIFVNGYPARGFEGILREWTGTGIALKAGWNEITVRLSPGSSGWAATFALRDPSSELEF